MSQESAVRALGGTDPTLPIPGAVAPERTRPQRITKAPDTPHPPVLGAYPDSSLRAFSKLNEAAQRIAQDDAASNRRLPRASRLAPFRDISAEIRRESTPLPKYSKMHPGRNPQEFEVPGAEEHGQNELTWGESGEQAIEDASWPNFWPWFDADSEEKEGEDAWANRTDPLLTRHRPSGVEAAVIEHEDIRRALAEGIPTSQLPVRVLPKKSPLRNIFIALAIFAVVALIIDGVLLAVLSGHSHTPASVRSRFSAASLTLTTNVVDFNQGQAAPQAVQVKLSNFAVHARVLLTHDTQDAVQTTTGSSVVQVGATGSATAEMIVKPEWGPGIHLIFAENVTTHDTASASLRVQIGGEQSQPPHLEIASSATPDLRTLDFGPGYPGAISDQAIQLRNGSNSGSITWSASSNQAWLLVSPSSGTFDHGQTAVVAVQRPTSAEPSDYTAIVTFASSAGTLKIPVKMSVSSLPATSAVLAVSPAVLSFTTTDGSSAAPAQQLMLTNPGEQPVSWSLTINAPSTASTQIAIARQSGPAGSWLAASRTSGTIPALSTVQIGVSVQTSTLLPGAYLGSLTFTAPGAVDSPQTVSVSLSVQPHCGLLATTGFLSFTTVQGKASAGSQTVGLSETTSCAGASIPWTAQVSAPSWLGVTPASGQLRGTASEFLTVSVNPAALAPQSQPYVGFLVFTTQKSTQTVLVQLLVQPPPPASSPEPIMGASPLNLNFSWTQGQPSPTGQVVTITNNGNGPLFWSSSAQPYGASWLSASPSGGQVPPGQSGSVTINVQTSQLSPGTYAGQVSLNGTDSKGNTASGGPQVVQVNLLVQPACTLTQPSSQALSFSGVQGGANPILQNVLMSGTGNCTWPLLISATSSASWLQVPPGAASIRGDGQSTSLAIGPGPGYSLLTAKTYTAQVTITATDSAGIVAQGSPQPITVTLTVLPPPPVLAVRLATLTFSQATGSSTQSIPVRNTGGEPLNWTAALAGNAPSYVTISSATSGTLAAGAKAIVTITVDTTNVPGGTNASTSVTISAIDPLTNAATAGSPATVTIAISTPAPALLLSTNTLTFTTTAGTNPAPQTITLSNGGGNGLTWTVGAPSQTWLSVSPTSGSDAAGATTPLTFSVDVTGLAAGSYVATVTITPAPGTAVTVSVDLLVN